MKQKTTYFFENSTTNSYLRYAHKLVPPVRTRTEEKISKHRFVRFVVNLLPCFLFSVLLFSCTFDYGTQDDSDKGLPDIVMESVEYVRMRSADPQARFQAERVERFEERRIMDLLNFSFEQYGNRGEEVNAYGRAGSGSMEIDSGDIRMDNTVRIEIEAEDIIIETIWLEWKDKDRILFGGETEEVIIQQQNGTTFTGVGFRINARYRTWEFSGHAEGTFVHEENEEGETAESEGADGGAGA